MSDGQAVALSMWRDGRRDLWLVSPEGEPLRRLTADTAIDADPVWSADGRWLFFTSDRSGIPNIYAVELATEALFQVTNVVTGAAKPSVHPSGERIAYQEYSNDGWDIRVLDLDPARFIPRGTLPRLARWPAPLSQLVKPAAGGEAEPLASVPSWEGDPLAAERGPGHTLLPRFAQDPPSDVLDSFDAPDLRDAFGEEEDYPFSVPVKRYNPLPTLVPRYVLPNIRTTPFGAGPNVQRLCGGPGAFCPGLYGALSTSGGDALSRYLWTANVNYRTDAEAGGGGASFVINRWLPVYTFAVDTRPVAAGQLLFVDPANPVDEAGDPLLLATDPPTIYWERRTTAAATVSWPYRLRESLFARYSLTYRTNLADLPAQVYGPSVVSTTASPHPSSKMLPAPSQARR